MPSRMKWQYVIDGALKLAEGCLDRALKGVQQAPDDFKRSKLWHARLERICDLAESLRMIVEPRSSGRPQKKRDDEILGIDFN